MAHPSTATAPADPLIGTTINDRFKVLGLVAKGGMGKVYKAEQSPLGRIVAVKVLHPNYSGDGDPEFSKRFTLEASVVSRLKHPNTVTVYDYGETADGVYFMAMEYLEGKTLHRLIREEGSLEVGRALHILVQVARSLREAHGQGVIHRDLKPANIFLIRHDDDSDFVKVLDFGIVRRAADQGDASLTKTGAIAGTPAYIAPEVTRGEEPTAAVDVYALGAVLYFLVAGRAPFEGASAMALLLAHLTEPVTPLSALGVVVPADVEALVMRCLEKSPDARPADAMELATLLAQTSVAGKWKPARVASPESVRGPRVTTGTEPTVEVSRAV